MIDMAMRQTSRRRAMPLLATALVLLLALCVGPTVDAAPAEEPVPSIVLDPQAGTVSGCDVIEVAVRIEDVTDLYGADVQLAFDASLLQVVDADPAAPGVQVEPGGFLSPPLSTAKNIVDNDLGTIWYAASQLNPTEPVSGSGDLIVVRFRARAPGVSDLEFTAHQLGDRDGGPIPADTEDGTLEATGPGCIQLVPDEVTVDGCETVDIEIWIGNVGNLYGADVRLSFDPAIVEVVDADAVEAGVQIEIGDLLAPPLWVARNEADNDAGAIWFAASQLNPTPPVQGAGVLAIIQLRAVGTGTSALGFTYTKMGDSDGEEIPGSATGGSVTTTGIAAPTLAIAKLDATTARLSWTGVDGIGTYHLYRDTYAYFDPGASPHASASGLLYDDEDALGDSAENYFYVVRSACDNGFESPISNRVGEFDFDLYPGTGPGLRKYNLIGYPLFMSAVPDANSLAAYIGAGVYQILRYDNATRGTEFWLPGLGIGTNFPTVVGEPYYGHLDPWAPELVTFAGDVPELGSVSFGLNRPAPLQSCRYNYLSVPLDRIDLLTADDLANDISSTGGVYQILRYDNATQAVSYWVPGLGIGDNFAVRVGYPYIACVTSTAPAVWP